MGRERELRILDRLLDEAAKGARTVVLQGEPGIGKSELVTALIDRAAERGFTTFKALGEEFQSDRPFAAIARSLSPHAGFDERRESILAALRVTPDSATSDHRYQIVAAFEELFEHEVLSQPALVALDDAHWADAGSLLVLNTIARRRDLPLLVAVACRPVPRPAQLKQLVQFALDGGGAVVDLASLNASEAERLIAERLDAALGPALRDQLEAAGGNPLYLLELVAGLEDEGLIDQTEGIADIRAALLPPPSLTALIVRRLSFLGESSMNMLRLAAVLGDPFSARDLATVSDTSVNDVLAALEDPIAAGFIDANDDGFVFRHDMVREALYADMPPAVRRARHLHVARSLAAAKIPIERLARHVSIGAEPGDRQAVEWLRQAALSVAAKAPDTAIELLERARSLLPDDDPEATMVALEEVTRLTYAGYLDEAKRLGAEVEPHVRGGPLASMFALLNMAGAALEFDIDELLVKAAAIAADDSTDEDTRMAAAAAQAGSLFARGEIAGAFEIVDGLHHYVQDNPASASAALISWLQAGMSMLHGSFGEALELFDRALPGTDLFIGGRAQGLTTLAMGYVQADRYGEARATLESARAYIEEHGTLAFLVFYHWTLSNLHFVTGAWDDAIAEIATSKGLEAARGAIGIGLGGIPDPTLYVHVFRQDLSAARTVLEETDRLTGTWWISHWVDPVRAILHSARGDDAAAVAVLRSWCTRMRVEDAVPDLRVVARSIVSIAREAAADDVLEDLLHGADRALAAAGAVKSVEAAALLVRGAITGATTDLLAALERARTTQRPFDLAEAAAETGLALLRHGDRDAGRPLIIEAFGIYEELGARRQEAALARDVREFGIRRGAVDRKAKPTFGWGSLTASERRVAELVAEGLTNAEIGRRLFTSRGTVATHLRSVFRKLDISSRSELAAEVIRRHSPAVNGEGS